MRKMKKILVFLLMACACMKFISLPLYAETTVQDGVEITVTTDKEEYSKDEDIETTLNVLNNGNLALTDLSLENIVPDGYKLKEGNLSSSVETLEPGASVQLKTTYAPDNQSTSEDVPADTNTNKDGKSGSPGTGDTNQSGLWASLLTISLIGGFTALYFAKKNSKKVISVLLCTAIAGTGVSASATDVIAENNTMSNSLTASATVIVEGENLTIDAVVKYSYETEESVYEVTFETNGGNDIASAYVIEGNTVNRPDDPHKTGYVFAGWFVDAELNEEYDFSSEVTSDITLYAKWERSSDDEYYQDNSEIIEKIRADESNDVLSEEEALLLLDDRDFYMYPVTYDHTVEGEGIETAEALEGSSVKHPTYQTVYVSENGEGWAVYIINGQIIANPVSYNLESELGVELLVSESDTLTSYIESTNTFYITKPQPSAVIVKVVDHIDAEALDKLTVEELRKEYEAE